MKKKPGCLGIYQVGTSDLVFCQGFWSCLANGIQCGLRFGGSFRGGLNVGKQVRAPGCLGYMSGMNTYGDYFINHLYRSDF